MLKRLSYGLCFRRWEGASATVVVCYDRRVFFTLFEIRLIKVMFVRFLGAVQK